MFVQQYTKLAAELQVELDNNGDSGDDGSRTDSEGSESELSELSGSGWESQGTDMLAIFETCSNTPNRQSTSTQMS